MTMRRWIFDLGAGLYDWMTWQGVWRAHSSSMVGGRDGFSARPKVLDLGTGPGISAMGILDVLPKAHVVGLDLSSKMLQRARKRVSGRVDLVLADAVKLPFADSSFDLITGHSFLYLLPDAAGALREVARVLRPGGRCVFVEPRQGPSLGPLRRSRGPIRFRLSMVLWRLVSARVGRFDEPGLRVLLEQELTQVELESALNGLAWMASASAVTGARGSELEGSSEAE